MEKTRQGQATLKRDFEGSCVFQNVLHVIPFGRRKEVLSHNFDLDSAVEWETHGTCVTHGLKCPFPTGQSGQLDLCLFGAPCVDDSSIGDLRQDDGDARQVTCR